MNKDLVLYAPVAIRLSCKASTRCSSLATLVSSPALPFQSWMKEDVPLCAGDEKINERKGEKVFVICQNKKVLRYQTRQQVACQPYHLLTGAPDQ